ncbi:MAG: hypothetical protein Q9188_003194 [Gyalolechia gomerana]
MDNLHHAPVHPGRSRGPQINDRSRRREKRAQQCEYAERVHQEGRNLDALNHQQRRYLGRRYSQWARRSRTNIHSGPGDLHSIHRRSAMADHESEIRSTDEHTHRNFMHEGGEDQFIVTHTTPNHRSSEEAGADQAPVQQPPYLHQSRRPNPDRSLRSQYRGPARGGRSRSPASRDVRSETRQLEQECRAILRKDEVLAQVHKAKMARWREELELRREQIELELGYERALADIQSRANA